MLDNSTIVLDEVLLDISDNAVEALKKMLFEDSSEFKYLRVGVDTGGCHGISYSLGLVEEKSDNDHTFDVSGIPVLVNEMALPYIKGCSLDYVTEESREGFLFNYPHAHGDDHECGCGGGCSC